MKVLAKCLALFLLAVLMTTAPVLAKGGGGGGGGHAGGGFSGSHSSGFGSSGGSVGGGYHGSSGTSSSSTSSSRSGGGYPVFIPVPIGGYRTGNSGSTGQSTGDALLAIFGVIALLVTAAIVLFFILGRRRLGAGSRPKLTVAQVDVRLLGSAATVPQEVHDLAMAADTSTQEGFSHLLSGAAQLLLRYKAYWHSAGYHGSIMAFNGAEAGFQALVASARERMAYETSDNVDGRRQQRERPAGVVLDDNDVDHAVVVTLTVATYAKIPFEAVSDTWLAATLEQIAGLEPSAVEAADVAWLPDAGEPMLTQNDLLADFPDLVPV